MGTYGVRKVLVLLLVLSLVIGDGLTAGKGRAAASQEADTTPAPEQPEVPEPSAAPTPAAPETPAPAPSVTPPVVTPAPTPVYGRYVLKSPSAKYKKGGQTGIHYRKVKGKKVYHISSYTTDTVQLTMSQPSTFSIYGGASKKEVKKSWQPYHPRGW